jgi:predicted peptidase
LRLGGKVFLKLIDMRILICLLVIFFCQNGFAQSLSLYQKKQFIRNGDTLRYRIMYPLNYKVNKKYPVITFLHGTGERGTDNETQLLNGSRFFADSSIRAKYPAFVIFPQCPKNDGWAQVGKRRNGNDSLGGLVYYSDRPITVSLGLLFMLMDSMAGSGAVKTDQIYLGGLSLGAMGSFEALWRKPNFFAAVISICGGGDPTKLKIGASTIPIWLFHGTNDKSVTVSNSRLLVRHLRRFNPNIRYTEYKGVGHNSWDYAFKEPGLMEWLFKQKRRD